MTLKSIQVDDARLEFTDLGAGATLLLVHGFPLDHSMWQRQVQELSTDYRVISVDLRGFGGSGITAGIVRMEQFADDLASVLDALAIDGPVALCGLSMGGYIAWEFWRRHPARLARLILCDTRAAADDQVTARGREQTAIRVLSEGPEFLADTMLEKLFSAATRASNPEIVAATREVIVRTAPDGIAAALRGMAVRRDFQEQLGQVTIPTLVIGGQQDLITPPQEMRVMAELLPDARFVEIPEAGHMAPLENPTAVNRALREFLDLSMVNRQ